MRVSVSLLSKVRQLVIVATAAAAGCGSDDEKLPVAAVPLPADVRVVAQAYGCPMTPDVCFRWVILEGGPDVKEQQERTLVARGWRFQDGTTPAAIAADAPSGKTFVSFETGAEELADIRRGKSDWGTMKLLARLRELVTARRSVLAVTIEEGVP